MNKHQVIALAGIIQAAEIIHQLATTGSTSPAIRNPLIHSLFIFKPETIDEVYNGSQNLSRGLQAFAHGLKDVPNQSKIYFYSIISLEKSLSQNQDTLTTLAAGLESIAEKLKYFEIDHENIIASIADLYTQTLSKLTPKIMIRGDQNLLTQPPITNEIRTLLLAGIRSAMLWRQYGGTKFSILWPWSGLPQTAQQILLNF